MKSDQDLFSFQPSRRDFLKKFSAGVAIAGGAALFANMGSCIFPDSTVDPSPTTGQKVKLTLANEPTLQVVGGFIRRTFGNNNGGNAVLVLRVAQNGTSAFKTMSVICTHAGCAVNNPSGNQVACPCHGSIFGAQNGNFANNLSGPAPSPLQTFQTSFDGSTISISF